MPYTTSQVLNAIGTLTGPSVLGAMVTRLHRNPAYRPVWAVLRTGRPASADVRAAVTAATAGDASATRTALLYVLDMNAAEAAQLSRTLFRTPGGRAYLLRINGRGSTGDLTGGGA